MKNEKDYYQLYYFLIKPFVLNFRWHFNASVITLVSFKLDKLHAIVLTTFPKASIILNIFS